MNRFAHPAAAVDRPAWARFDFRAALELLGVVAAAAAVGALAALGAGEELLILGAFLAALAAALVSWRRSIRWMLLYLPFSGLMPLLMYPDTGLGVLVKDIFFIGPAYAGALVAAIRGRQSLRVPGVPVVLLLCFVALLLVESFNPSVPKPMVALLGLKVWLSYLPLVVLGYYLFDSLEDAQRLLKRMLIVAMVPCVLGIIEAGLVYNGQRDFVYSLYGPAAAASTQDFATFEFGLTRISSIFTFISQYWLFSTATIAVGYAAWRGSRNDRTMAWFGPLAIAIAIIASMTSGARAAFIFSPLLLLMIVMLDGLRLKRLLAIAVASGLGVLAALALSNVPLQPLSTSTGQHANFIIALFGDGISYAAEHSPWGLGVGVDTNAARYAFPGVADPGVIWSTVGGVWWESWYLKAALELGFVGLFLLMALIAVTLWRSLVNHWAVQDPEARAMSAAFVALFIWIIIYTVKTAYIDFDPMAIYIWLFLGIQWRLRSLPAKRSAVGAKRG